MSYTQTGTHTRTHTQFQLWKLSSHGQLVTLHIGSQRVGRTDVLCVPTSTPECVCLCGLIFECVCVFVPSSLRPVQRGLIEFIQFPLLLFFGLATVCQQVTKTIYNFEDTVPDTHTHSANSLSHCLPVSPSVRHLVGYKELIKGAVYAEDLQGACVNWTNGCAGTSLCQYLCVQWGGRVTGWPLWKLSAEQEGHARSLGEVTASHCGNTADKKSSARQHGCKMCSLQHKTKATDSNRPTFLFWASELNNIPGCDSITEIQLVEVFFFS